MDRFVEAETFVAIAEHGSIAKAARAVRRPPSRVSRILSDIEGRLGVALANRTTRSLSLTEAGEQFRLHCETALEALKTAEQLATQKHLDLTGTLHILGVNVFSQQTIVGAIHEFAERHTGLVLKLQQSDNIADLVKSGADMALRIGEIPSKRLTSLPIAPSSRILCASPDYLARKGHPKTIEDLENHSCLVLEASVGGFWEIETEGRIREITPVPTMTSNRAETLRVAALDGWGIVQLSDILIGDDLAAGRLVSLFPRSRVTVTNQLCAIYPRQHHVPSKVLRLAAHLTQRLKQSGQGRA